MSKYTTELRFICKSLLGGKDLQTPLKVNDVIKNARELIFDFEYPIFDEKYKTILEKKIIKNFYTREISLETFGLWKLRLDVKMNEIMPFYNQLYESELLKFNPLSDVNYNESYKGGTKEKIASSINSDISESSTENVNKNNHGNGSNTINTDTWELFNKTPHGRLDNIHSGDNSYLTNATNNKGNEVVNNDYTESKQGVTKQVKDVNKNNNESKTIDNVDEYIKTVSGKKGVNNYSELLINFRKTFLNIDKMIIDELEDLFIQLW